MPPAKPRATRPPPRKRTRPTPPPASPPPSTSTTPTLTYTPLATHLSTVFDSAQKTTAGHRKLAVTLRATYEQCIAGTGAIGSTLPGGGQKGEKVFVKEFFRFLDRVLVVKKGEVVADRCLRFVDVFVRGVLERDKPKPKRKKAAKPSSDAAATTDSGVPAEPPAEEEEEEVEPPFDPATFVPQPQHRFVLALLQHLTSYLGSREKSVRYRTTQLLSLLLSNTLPTFPFEFSSVSKRIFTKALIELCKRLKDKETPVRVQAVVGVVRLLEMGVDGDEEDASDDEGIGGKAGGALNMLLDAIERDPSAEVRRTVLYNVPPTPETLPYLLARTRDVDSATRRSVFTRLLPTLGDFRHLSIGMREKLLRWGLNDRDESVRIAARKMFNYRWVEDAEGDILEVLERLDVAGDGSEGGVKEVAMKGFWTERKDVIDAIDLNEDYWENLTAESAFLARSFNDYARSLKPGEGREELEEKMPEVTKLAFWLQKYINKLVTALEEGTDEVAELEFVVEQMLMIALKTDYGDEIGRRRMFSLLRDCLGIPQMAEGVTKLIVECLSRLSMGEGDFCMLILEVIAEVHDTIEDDQEGDETVGDDAASESFHSAQSDLEEGDSITVKGGRKEREAAEKAEKAAAEKKAKEKAKKKKKGKAPQQQDEDVDMMDIDGEEDHGEEEEEEEEARAIKEMMINLKCLHIAQCMLENVEGSLKQNTHLVGMLNGLIVPAVRSHEAPVRERGLHCLGLSCLLDPTLAEQNLALFAHCFNKGHEALQISALHIISDILTIHGSALFTPSPDSQSAIDQRGLYRLFAKALKLDDHTEVQATAVEVVCKLMLAQVIQDDELLKFLVVAYFDPATVDNHALRQILTYFFPVYCHSRPENQARMARGAVGIMHALMLMHDALGDEEEMVSMAVVSAQISDWTDPRKNVGGGVSAGKNGIAEKIVDPDVHVVMAGEMLERALTNGCPREEKKVLLTMLGKLYIPADATPDKLRALYELIAHAIEENIAPDAPSRNSLNKLEVALGKIVGDLAEQADETVIVPTGDGDEEEDGEESDGEGTVVTAIMDEADKPENRREREEEMQDNEEEEEDEE